MAISSGGFELVSAGGIALGIVVSDGGNETVFSGGLAAATVVDAGGFAVALAGWCHSSWYHCRFRWDSRSYPAGGVGHGDCRETVAAV